METRVLGQSGLRVSVVGLGCNNFGGMVAGLDDSAAERVIHAALDAGITLFDTSDSYGAEGGSERVLGAALKGRRDGVMLATKFASPLGGSGKSGYDGSRRHVFHAVEGSLRRLGTDHIDLYQYHFPDPLTPLEETLRALEDLVRAGKVRYIACSNLPAWQLVDASWTARYHGLGRFVSTQAEYNLLSRDVEDSLFPALRATGMSLLPYFPLASGLLTGKYRRGALPEQGRLIDLPYFKAGLTQERLDRIEALAAIAEAHGRNLLDLAFAWLLAEPLVGSVMAGATKPEQVIANAEAARWRLDAAMRDEISQALA
ncbi:aldo/keto reductase [Oceanicola sp. S124]|uniref:aldo/keto reductase n=1 Tax=Oceanicola sp. S124 TaxID=1042378 RepID=UPI0002557D26|nr:aldo/keto reductase [Oceanicola sp. S124]